MNIGIEMDGNINVSNNTSKTTIGEDEIQEGFIDKKAESNAEETYVVYKWRWLNLLLFSLCNMMNQIAWISLQPVADDISLYYKQSINIVNTLSIVFQALYVVFTFPSNYAIDIYGLRKSTVLGILLTAIGAIIKCFVNSGFNIIIVGQVFCAIGGPFLCNS